MYKYHPLAKLTVRQREEIHENKEGLTVLEQAKKYNVSVPTIMKWRHRTVFEDAEYGVKDIYNKHTSITRLEEYIICEIRKLTLLPLDDLLDIVSGIGIDITRSSLYRALKRNGLHRLKDLIKAKEGEEGIDKKTGKFKEYGVGYIHIDIKYLPKIEGKRYYLYVAIDRASRLVFVRVYEDKKSITAAEFLEEAIKYFPFKIRKVLTDNGKEFTDRYQRGREEISGEHVFDRVCSKRGIEHRLTKPFSPNTNGMVERFNGRISQDVIDKVRFKDYKDMIQKIYEYVYLYNHYIKHSGIGRISPIDKLKQLYKENKKNTLFTKDLNEFIIYDKQIFNISNNIEEHDNHLNLLSSYIYSVSYLLPKILDLKNNPSKYLFLFYKFL